MKMFTLYKKDQKEVEGRKIDYVKVCKCLGSQLELMKKDGWSDKKIVIEEKTENKKVK